MNQTIMTITENFGNGDVVVKTIFDGDKVGFCKKEAGRDFSIHGFVTSASVVAPNGEMVLDLEKNPDTKECVKRVSKEWLPF